LARKKYFSPIAVELRSSKEDPNSTNAEIRVPVTFKHMESDTTVEIFLNRSLLFFFEELHDSQFNPSRLPYHIAEFGHPVFDTNLQLKYTYNPEEGELQISKVPDIGTIYITIEHFLLAHIVYMRLIDHFWDSIALMSTFNLSIKAEFNVEDIEQEPLLLLHFSLKLDPAMSPLTWSIYPNEDTPALAQVQGLTRFYTASTRLYPNPQLYKAKGSGEIEFGLQLWCDNEPGTLVLKIDDEKLSLHYRTHNQDYEIEQPELLAYIFTAILDFYKSLIKG